MSHQTIAETCPEQTPPQSPPTQRRLPIPLTPCHGLRDYPSRPSLLLPPPWLLLSSTSQVPSSRKHEVLLAAQFSLNPKDQMLEQPRDQRDSQFLAGTPSLAGTQRSHSLPSICQLPGVDSLQDEQQSPTLTQQPGRLPASRVPTPKSPTLHRRQSLDRREGTVDADLSSPLTSNVPPKDAPVSCTACPTPAAATGSGNAPPWTAQTLTLSLPHSDACWKVPLLRSASPIRQSPPYSRSASIAAGYDVHGIPAPCTPLPQGDALPAAPGSAPLLEMEYNMTCIGPTAQTSIRLMTIQSQQGHDVQIPVDVRSASKLVDEKRSRNARASARFRVRRKEREREVATSIARLEQKVRHATDKANSYRCERDFFRSIIYQQSSAERHCARPASRTLRHPSPTLSPALCSLDSSVADGIRGEYEGEVCDLDCNMGVRTSDCRPIFEPPLTGAGAFNTRRCPSSHARKTY